MAWRRHARDEEPFDGGYLETALADVSDAYESQSGRPEFYTKDLSKDPPAVARALRGYAETCP